MSNEYIHDCNYFCKDGIHISLIYPLGNIISKEDVLKEYEKNKDVLHMEILSITDVIEYPECPTKDILVVDSNGNICPDMSAVKHLDIHPPYRIKYKFI